MKHRGNCRKCATQVVFFYALLCAGCGSSSDDEILFSGTVNRPEGVVVDSVERVPLVGLQVCALGECATSNASGFWMLSVGSEVFAGGDVQFTFTGGGINTSFVAEDLSAESDFIELNFLISRAGEVDVIVLADADDGDTPAETDELFEQVPDAFDDTLGNMS